MRETKTNTFSTIEKLNRQSMDSVLSELRNSYFFIAWKARVEEYEAKQKESCKEDEERKEKSSFEPYYINKEIGKAM